MLGASIAQLRAEGVLAAEGDGSALNRRTPRCRREGGGAAVRRFRPQKDRVDSTPCSARR